jgi:ATP-dependent Clp protease ATP-binding subunit ClpA
VGQLPQTPRARKVIEFAIEEARDLNHNYVGTEHLLLGLLREQEGVAAQVLMNLGLSLPDVREEILNLLGHGTEVGICRGSLPRVESSSGSEAEPRSESLELPGSVQESVQTLRYQIEQFNLEKEEAVSQHAFEKAAHLRDVGEKLKRKVRALLGQWPAEYVIDPAWLSWNDGTVRKLAQVIQKERQWDNLPVLADALEEAGCADRRLLDHCRQRLRHPCGCWVIDLLLGRVPYASG